MVASKFSLKIVITVVAGLISFTAPTILGVPSLDPKLHQFLENDHTINLESKSSHVNIFVTLKSGTNGIIDSHSASVKNNRQAGSSDFSRGDQITTLYQNLLQHSKTSQEQLLAKIQQSKSFSSLKIQSFWITNQIYIQNVTKELLRNLLLLDEDIKSIDLEEIIQLEDLEPLEINEEQDSLEIHKCEVEECEDNYGEFQSIYNDTTEGWNIELIQGPEARNLGNGSGILIGIIDTGVRGTHEALKDNYKNDAYSWFDTNEGYEIPTDVQGHGTHIMGTILGTVNGIGLATGAKWIACKAFYSNGQAYQHDILSCGQYLLCPFRTNGLRNQDQNLDHDCSHAPHIISNSWNSMNGSAAWFLDIINAWHAAQIIPVFSAGNYGPECNTLGSQAGQQVIAVGSTTINDTISWFSSVGPSFKNETKPDLSAPGHSVRSAFHTTDESYAIWSGTSFACPHVVGVIAMMLSRDPALNYEEIKNILEISTDKNLTFVGEICGGIEDNEFPNNFFGHGRLNAFNAMKLVNPTNDGIRNQLPASFLIFVVVVCCNFYFKSVIN